MIAIVHFADEGAGPDGAGDFAARAREALEALAQRPGYRRGTLARATDDAAWVLVTEWENIGSYRRALGNFDVRVRTIPLLGGARDLPSAFEEIVEVAPGGAAITHVSDREPER